MSNILTIRHPPWRLTLGRFVLRIRFVALCLVALALSGVLPASAGADATSGRLSGLIEDDKGTVLPGSQLRLTDATGTTTATANEQGRYSASVPPGLYDITVSAHAQDGPPLEAKVREVEVGEDSRLNLVLAGQPIQTATLTGTLRDAAGVPISAAHVSAGAQTVTDNEGAFVLEVPSGRYGLAVDLLWGSGAVNAWVEDFDLSQDRRVDLTLPLISIDVSVRNEAGSALGGAEVSVSSGENCPVPGFV